MLGHDHALSGALAFVAVAPLLPVSGTQLAVAATLTAGAGILPDLDEPGSTIARTFGFLTGAFAWIVHQLSGGHRKGTHSLLGLALLTIAALWAGSWQQRAAASLHHGELWWHLVPAGLIMALTGSAMAPEKRAFGMGVFLSVYFLLQAPAPALAGWLYDRTGNPFVPILLAIALFGLTLLSYAAFRLAQRTLR